MNNNSNNLESILVPVKSVRKISTSVRRHRSFKSPGYDDKKGLGERKL